jgi:hypothetical protein
LQQLDLVAEDDVVDGAPGGHVAIHMATIGELAIAR